jgi:hypothetical protein
MLGDKIDAARGGAPERVTRTWHAMIRAEDKDVSNISPIGSRETVAESFASLSAEQQSWLVLLMENPANDDLLLTGLHVYLDQASEARFLNSLKLQKSGEWLGNAAPARLQIRIAEAAKSSQHPAFQAFKEGLDQSGGFERAYPKARV